MLHLATQHEKLKDVMEADLRPEVQQVCRSMYPAVVDDGVRVKLEGVRGGLERNLEREEDVDDPAPSNAGLVKTPPVSKSTPDVKPKVEAAVNLGPKYQIFVNGKVIFLSP